MSRIDRYLLAQLLAVFAFFSLVLVSVYWVNRAARLFDALIGDGQSFWVFLELSALTLPNVIRVVLPLSAFAAAVYVAIRMSRDNEMVVLQGSGMSYLRMLRPVALFGVIVALMLALLMHVLMPLSRAQLTERQVEIAENITTRFLRAGEFLEPADGIVVFLRNVTPEGKLEDVFLSDARSPGTRVEYNAASALLVPGPQGPVLVMLDGVALIYSEGSERLTTIAFDDLSYDVGALIGPAGRGPDVRELPTRLLRDADSATLAPMGLTLAEVRFELMSRHAQPLLAVVTSLIGFAAVFLGQFSRLGAWRQVLAAIVALALIQLVGNASSGPALRDAARAGLAFVPVGLGLVVMGAMVLWVSWPRRMRQRGRI
ncbi:lipopolysaccharide export system permease protein [Roseinatronobacter thiooxidans]|uniref:Lipopolysaccharide export system permease protein n=1 Tax=Roseinatronobacter thiooxidans TaxID=121821 RepID=A0A2W7QKU2_9RHOB|nr:LPS export ABC transporter permease LptF [Roseinatronobacter thiooxidans]PZX47916.1 lipopolysaccharide export system permease protein [Roseinatronobacter thiooxidans]